MPVTTDGPIFKAFESVLAIGDSPLNEETKECSASLIRLLEHHQTTARKPGMLLGKVQSGKTRAFVGALAIGFDSGFDIAVVLTKTSTPLAVQTKRRLQHDLAPAIRENRVRIYDASTRIGPLNDWLQNLKLIFVAKKHPKNLEHLRDALLVDHPTFRNKNVLIIDDEADFASVGYQRRKGTVQVRTVQTLINALREGLSNSVYLEVTATPYSLYLQPADIEEPATGHTFQAVRPAFTKRVPIHAGYIGGEFYFDQARELGSVASFVHVPVSDAELSGMSQSGAISSNALLSDPSLASLRRALISFIVGGVMRHNDDSTSNRPQRLFSFIVHLERLRAAHSDQQLLAQRLIDELRKADLQSEPVASQLQAAYDDLRQSRDAANMVTKLLSELLPDIKVAFNSVTPEIVNSDKKLEQLLDEDGQLLQQSPFNIYIGGQSLDRGVTIANVIGFFYGRNPQTAQQDTTIQHCRMYGNRPVEDLSVTRFYTSPGIYSRMNMMHEFDQMLWAQLRERDENGDIVDEPGDVIFLERDASGQISPCSPNKIILTKAQWVSPRGELVPRPFSTISNLPDNPDALRVTGILQRMGQSSKPFEMRVDQACDLLDAVCELIKIDQDWDWDLDALKEAVRFIASRHADPTRRDSVFGIYTLDNTIRKWNDATHTDPQRAPYSRPTEASLRTAAGACPGIGFYHNVGEIEQGWSGSPFVWPVLFVPENVVPAVFANNRRRSHPSLRRR